MKKHIQCHFVIQVVIASPALEPLAKEVTNWEKSAAPWLKDQIGRSTEVRKRLGEEDYPESAGQNPRDKMETKMETRCTVDTVLYSLSSLMNRNLVSFSGPTVSLEYFKSKDPNVKCLWYVESFQSFPMLKHVASVCHITWGYGTWPPSSLIITSTLLPGLIGHESLVERSFSCSTPWTKVDSLNSTSALNFVNPKIPSTPLNWRIGPGSR